MEHDVAQSQPRGQPSATRDQPRELTRLEQLLRISVNVLAASCVEEILEQAAEGARELIGAAAAIAVHGLPERALRTRSAHAGPPEATGGAEALRPVVGPLLAELAGQEESLRLTGRALAARRTGWCVDPEAFPRRNLLATPLADGAGRTVGLIAVCDAPGGFLDEDEAALRQLATLAALVLRNIEARNEAQARAAEAEEGKRILDALMSYIPEGITIAEGPEVIIRMTSRYGQRMIGYEPEELADVTAREQGLRWNLLRADGTTAYVNELPLARAARRGEVVTNEELMLQRLNGTTVPVSCNSGPILDREGRIIGAVMAWRDIAERKRAEQAQREADRRKDEFLALLTHELRNPLAPLISAVKILEQAPAGAEVAREALQVIERQVWHMVRLIDDLLDVSRITRGKIRLRREPVDLALIVESAVTANLPLIEQRAHHFAVSYPVAPVLVDADPTRLTQVLSNLLNNAAKYTPPGGSLWLTAERAGEEVQIHVIDDGPGIPAHQVPELFEMFSQGTEARQGLGVGLALARQLTELHGGALELRDRERGTGAEFVVRLPVLSGADRRAAAAPCAARAADADDALKILVVDDSPDAARSLAALLELLGHEVTVALDGAAGLCAVERDRPQAVILDLGMPELDGFAVARQLRERFGREELLLVALTGRSQVADRRRAAAAGFDHHLIKPARPAELRGLLERFARQRRATATGRGVSR